MRIFPTVLITIVLLFNSCEIQKKELTESQIIVPEDKEILTHFKEVLWPKAYAEQDTVLLDRMLGNDFQMIADDGKWYTKKDELDWIKENAMQNDSFRYEIKRLDILPNGTALICGTGNIVNDTVKSTYQSSNILIKRNGVWKAVASHVSGVKIIKS